jgi:hypothetical protein
MTESLVWAALAIVGLWVVLSVVAMIVMVLVTWRAPRRRT